MSVTCRWTYDGKQFNSERDLDAYLEKEHLSAVESQSDIVFEKVQKNSKTIEILKTAGDLAKERLDHKRNAAVEAMLKREINRTEEIENKTVDDSPAEVYADDYQAVSEYVYNTGELSRLNVDDYVRTRLTQLSLNLTSEDMDKVSEVRKQNPNLITDLDVFNKVIDNELLQWKHIRKTGKALDRIFGIVINQKGLYYNHFVDAEGLFNIDEFIDQFANWKDSSGESWYDLQGLYTEEIQSDGSLKKVSPVLQNFINQIQRLKREELNIKYTDKVFYQYTSDYATTSDMSAGIRGKMDIVIVRPGGRVDIYDIKVSSKDAKGLGKNTEWDVDKVKATEYQLGFYGRMIENLGIDPSKITLNIIPIQLRNIRNSMTGDIKVSAPVRIVPRSDIQRFINTTIPVTLAASPKSEEIRNNIKTTLEGMFPTIQVNNQILNVHDDYFIETKKIRKEGNKFVFTHNTKDESKPIYSDTKEEALEKYKEYLKEKVEDSRSWFISLKSSLNKALDIYAEGKINTFDQLFDNKVPSNIQLNFKKYLSNEGWEFASLSPEIGAVLDDLNIMVLYNNRTGVHDILSLSSFDLDRIIKMKFGTTILGNYKNDNQASVARKSSLGNILLMRNMAVANALTKAMPNIDFIFGEISTFDSRNDRDTSYGKMYSLPSFKLIDEAKTLHSLSGDSFEITSGNIMSADEYVQDLFNLIQRSLDETGYDAAPGARLSKGLKEGLGSTFKNFETIENAADRLEMLQKLWVDLNNIYGKDKSTVSRLMESTDYDGFIYRETARLLALSSDTFMDLYNFESIPKWGLENILTSFRKRNTLNGTMTMTIDTIPIVKTVHDAVQKVNLRIRHDMEAYKTKENRDMFKLAGLGSNMGMFRVKDFYDQSEEGKRLFLFKNPDTDSSLSPDLKKFLTWYLLKINELQSGHKLTDEEISTLKTNGDYYKVPLLRRSNYSRLVNGNKNKFNPKTWYQEGVNELYNIRNAAIGQEELFDKESDYRDMVLMYNVFSQSDESRTRMLSEADGDTFDYYEAHPEVIMDHYVMSKATFEQYNTILPAITASVACLQALGYSSGVDVQEAYDYINKTIKSVVFNESLLPRNELLKVVQVAKSGVSKAVLGYNLLSGGKEIMNGIYYHYTRALANSATGNTDKVGIADISKAYSTVWVDCLKQPAMITKLEKINFRFAMSNMDTNALAENQGYYKTDPLRFKYFMYWTNRAPDFLNRMTVLTGYMYKYGAYDAYSVNKDTDLLEYDWKKDGRFNLLASNDKSNMTAYLEQRALYSKMMEDFIEQGYEYTDPQTGKKRALNWNSNNFNDETNDQLPDGFTNKQIKSIKQESDRAFGYMDHDTKSLMFKTGITSIIFQFKTFATAKLSQWLLKPGVYDLGNYKQMIDPTTGEPLYRKVVQLEDGSWDSEFVTTLFIEVNGLKVELEPAKEWIGSPMEGMLWSMVDLLSPFTLLNSEKRKEMWSNPQKRANLFIAGQELFLLLMLLWLISAMYPDQEPRDIDNYFERNMIIMLNNSRLDLDPIDTILKGNITLDFTAWDFYERFVPEVFGAVTGQENRSWYKVASRFGATSTFRKELYDAHRTTLDN